MTTDGFAFLLAPGAGAPSSHLRMQDFARLFRAARPVDLLDYPYMLAGRKRPDPLPQLVAAHRLALAGLVSRHNGPIVLAGKSMGGRVGCHLALQEPVAGLICLGYPLCGAGDRSKLRDQVLIDLRTPILFVQGTRDKLCPLDLLEDVRKNMKAPSHLHVVAGGDHSLIVSKTELKTKGTTQADVDAKIGEAITDFLGHLEPSKA
jgi:predicted alpha/beta-hydrolase family hydrolase